MEHFSLFGKFICLIVDIFHSLCAGYLAYGFFCSALFYYLNL